MLMTKRQFLAYLKRRVGQQKTPETQKAFSDILQIAGGLEPGQIYEFKQNHQPGIVGVMRTYHSRKRGPRLKVFLLASERTREPKGCICRVALHPSLKAVPITVGDFPIYLTWGLTPQFLEMLRTV